MQYRNGLITSTGAAVSLQLGFVPDKFQVTDLSVISTGSGNGVGYTQWFTNMPAASALIDTYTSGAPVRTYITTNGFTPVFTGGVWTPTNSYVITGVSKANPGVVTLSSLTPTGATTLANGMTVTISGVNGMIQLNQNRYIVSGISGSTFTLYDTFGNPVNTTGFGTYTSGGQLDLISYPATAPVLNATTGQVITPGSPAGLQLDTGYAGITLGSSVVGSSTDVLFWEAFYATPTGW